MPMAEAEPQSRERPQHLVAFETLIADLGTRFINLPAQDLDRELADVLRRICDWFGIDFAALWQWSSASPGVILATHYYYAEEGRQAPESLDQEQFPWYREQMLAGKTVAIASLDELPAEAAVDRESGRRLGIRSSLCLPLAMGGEAPLGAIALNSLKDARGSSPTAVNRLQLVAQIIANALARQRAHDALSESRERLSLAAEAAEAAGAGLWTFDDRAGVFWTTPRARAIFGYATNEIITAQRFEASVHPDDLDRVREAIECSQRTGEAFDVEYRIRLPGEADVRWIASRGRPAATSGAVGRGLMGISLDITERKRLTDQLCAKEARLVAGAELAGLGFYETDYRRGVMHGDGRFCDLLGVAHQRTCAMDTVQLWMERLHPEDRSRVLDLREQLHSGERERISDEYRYLHPGRGEFWIHHLAAAVERDANGRMVRNIGVLRDIGHQKQSELELREMSQRLLQAQERERALIARELHDDLSQRLAVLAIEVARAEGASADAGQAAILGSVREQLVRVSEDVHTLAYQLHPSVLEELGLAEALRAECERRSRQSRLELSVSISPLPDEVGDETALCLFRVAQEALSNLIRHAGAGKASVQLRQQDGGLLLAVHDDGHGFNPKRPEAARRLGLASMRERLRMVNGTLDIDSAPGSGTTVIAWAPVGGGPR
jgi:PAS domain S-box-containing protein